MKSPTTIAFYLQPGVEVLDFAGPLEVFSYAGFDIFIVSKTRDPILSQGVLKVVPDYAIDDAPAADIIAFFGGNATPSAEDTKVINWLKSQDPQYYFSVCTGAFFLGEAGLLNGQTATTFHQALDDLARRYPDTDVRRDVRFVDNDSLITTAGISAGIDGALHLVARLRGFNKARSVAYFMEYDKWIPGEGLILSDENPYRSLPARTTLAAYEGEYHNEASDTLKIRYEPRERSLVALVQESRYPLYYEAEHSFTTVDGDPVVFQHDKKGRITGFRVGEGKGLFWRKQ